MAQVMYFILDTSNPDFDTAKEQAAIAQQAYVGPNSVLSCRYNVDGTKACMKVVGGSVNWYENSQWLNHPGILTVYTNENDNYPNHSDLYTEMEQPEWQWDLPEDNSFAQMKRDIEALKQHHVTP